MLNVLLKILSILGILLLALLGIVLALLLIALFLPITYRVRAARKPLPAKRDLSEEKAAGEGEEAAYQINAAVKVNWLFGLLRIRFLYPEPGKLKVKLLCFTIFDPDKQNKAKDGNDRHSQPNAQEAEEPKEAPNEPEEPKEMPREPAGATEETEQEPERKEKKNIPGKGRGLFENITYYKELLTCDDTRGLLDHAFRRLGKILKSIGPRKLKAVVLFGTGSPDTTGYLLGVYGMMSPHLGKTVDITPDFTQAVLEGEISASGHIMVFQLLRHGVMVILDKRLRRLYKQLKSGKPGETKQAKVTKEKKKR